MPDILTSDVQSQYLTSKAQNAEELDLLIDRAERMVINRYRENASRNDFRLGNGQDVRLDGWASTDSGPDPGSMDEDLLDSLRAAIAAVVEHWASRPDEADHVQSMSQGARSVTFRDAKGELPRGVYAPLRPFDERTTLFSIG
jgi:hypothetical protein